MPDLGPAFNQLSAPEKAAVMKAVDILARQYPETAGDVSVTSAYGSITLSVKAAAGRDVVIQSDMMGPITDIMLSSGILIVLLVSRKD